MNKSLKIGVLFTAYNCSRYLKLCFDPWFNLKEKYNLKFAINSGMFKAYKDLGFPDRNDETLDIIYKYKFDFLINTRDSLLLDEDSSRNNCLNYLKDIQGCDLIWLVDGDENYDEKQIIKTIDFIQSNPRADWYTVFFRNFTFTKKFYLDFSRPNIYWTDRNGGIEKFYFDCNVLYKDGTTYNQKQNTNIPKSILFVDHYAWLTDDTRSKEKIDYQKTRHSGDVDIRCSYISDNNILYFNKNFYDIRNINYPLLHEYSTILDNRFFIDYIYKDTKLIIYSEEALTNVTVKIFDLAGDLIFNWVLDVGMYYKYWHSVNLNGSYLFQIYVADKLTHSENIHVCAKMFKF